MRIDLYDICGIFGGALMAWWSLALFNFSMKYDENESRGKRSAFLVMLIVGFITVVVNGLDLFNKIF